MIYTLNILTPSNHTFITLSPYLERLHNTGRNGAPKMCTFEPSCI